MAAGTKSSAAFASKKDALMRAVSWGFTRCFFLKRSDTLEAFGGCYIDICVIDIQLRDIYIKTYSILFCDMIYSYTYYVYIDILSCSYHK